jgi:hypothetical protein
MNQRIQELALQAGMHIVDDKFSTYGKFAEKFAELIVRECADIADEPTSRPFDSYGKKIKQHFGV